MDTQVRIPARTEGIMKEVIDGMLAGAVCVWEVALVFVTMLALYTVPLRGNDRRTNRSENRAAPPPFLLAFPFCLRCCFRLSFVCDLNDVILAVRKCRNGIFR